MTHLPRNHQSGAVLFVALIMLLIITLLGIGSMREVILETRITGNLIEQKRLQNSAESALREGERRILNADSIEKCGTTVPCYISEATDENYTFTKVVTYSGLDGKTTLTRPARWYVRFIGGPYTAGSTSASANGASNALASAETAEAGTSFYYEVNAQAFKGDADDAPTTCTAATLCMTSTVTLLKE